MPKHEKRIVPREEESGTREEGKSRSVGVVELAEPWIAQGRDDRSWQQNQSARHRRETADDLRVTGENEAHADVERLQEQVGEQGEEESLIAQDRDVEKKASATPAHPDEHEDENERADQAGPEDRVAQASTQLIETDQEARHCSGRDDETTPIKRRMFDTVIFADEFQADDQDNCAQGDDDPENHAPAPQFFDDSAECRSERGSEGDDQSDDAHPIPAL